jgi:hypothetical protein
LKSFGHSGFLVNFQVSNFCHVIYIYRHTCLEVLSL